MSSGPRSVIRKLSFSMYLELMFIVRQVKWISEPALLIEPLILCKAIGLVSRQWRMLCYVTNLLLMKIAVAPGSSMARVQAFLFVPLTTTEKWKWEENGSIVYTVQKEMESNIVVGLLSDRVSETMGLDDTVLSWVHSKNSPLCWPEALQSVSEIEPQSF
jgi:hypothetical protein